MGLDLRFEGALSARLNKFVEKVSRSGYSHCVATLVREMTVEAARERRDRLVEDLGFKRDELDARADVYALTEEEAAVYDEVQRLEFLIGE